MVPANSTMYKSRSRSQMQRDDANTEAEQLDPSELWKDRNLQPKSKQEKEQWERRAVAEQLQLWKSRELWEHRAMGIDLCGT